MLSWPIDCKTKSPTGTATGITEIRAALFQDIPHFFRIIARPDQDQTNKIKNGSNKTLEDKVVGFVRYISVKKVTDASRKTLGIALRFIAL